MKTVNSLEYSRDLVEQETELAMDDRIVKSHLAQETHASHQQAITTLVCSSTGLYGEAKERELEIRAILTQPN